MKIAVAGTDTLKQEFLSKGVPPSCEVVFTNDLQNVNADTDVVFDFLFDNTVERVALLKSFLPKPVVVNAVSATLAEIDQPFIRINAWPGFLSRSIVEVAALPSQQDTAAGLFATLGWQYKLVEDIPGMISARIITMIINEAWFTFGEGVSTKEEIDIAMKLGTNYPHGPFAWGETIGMKNVLELIQKLQHNNDRYEIAPALIESFDN